MGGSTPYHHGDLPTALLAAVEDTLREGGPAAVSLRGIARRAGVSHAAPAHHFGDRGGLLAAFSAAGFHAFHRHMVETVTALPPGATVADAFLRMGQEYLVFAQQHVAHYRMMFRPELVDCSRPELQVAGGCAWGAVLAVARAALADDVDDHQVVALAMGAWATVHGLVSLALDLPSDEMDHVPDPSDMTDAFGESTLAILLAGMRAHPAWVGDDVDAARIPADLSDPLVPLQVPAA